MFYRVLGPLAAENFILAMSKNVGFSKVFALREGSVFHQLQASKNVQRMVPILWNRPHVVSETDYSSSSECVFGLVKKKALTSYFFGVRG